jgi:hypothetical protein
MAPRLGAALAMALACAATQAAPDAAALQRGQEVYARCAACHSVEGNRTGPQHCGLFGRRAGAAPARRPNRPQCWGPVRLPSTEWQAAQRAYTSWPRRRASASGAANAAPASPAASAAASGNVLTT